MALNNTLKTRLFVNESMRNKTLVEVPGIGEVTERKLREHGIKSAKELYNVWLKKFNRDDCKFDTWLIKICGNDCFNVPLGLTNRALELWHAKHEHQHEHEHNNRKEAESKTNRSNKRRSIKDAQPRHKRKRTDSSNLDSSTTSPVRTPNPVLTSNTEELDVALMAEHDKPLYEMQVTAVNQYIEESILASAKDPNGSTPRITKMSLTDGALHLSCENAQSLEWLKTTFANAPEIEGTKVTVKRKSELPRKFKASLFIPDCKHSVNDTLFLLTQQNEWAEIETWKKVSETVAGSTVFLEFLIPETVIRAIVQKGGQLFYILRSVPVMLHATDGYEPVARKHT